MGSTGAVRLSAVDVFHLRLHQEMCRRGQAGNSCSLVLELDGRVDEVQLEARARRAAEQVPELRWRLGRNLRLQPAWRERSRLAAMPVTTHPLGPRESVLDATTAWLDRPLAAGQTWQLRVLRGAESDAVVLKWSHPLADARGGERLLSWLGQGRGSLPPPPERARRFSSIDDRVRRIEPGERWAMLRSYRDHVLGIAEGAIASLDSVTGRRRPGRTRAVRLCIDRDRTSAFDRALRSRAGLSESHLLTYGAARLVDRALGTHQVAVEQHTVVVPVSLDPARGSDRMFGNNLTMMMLELSREDLSDPDRALGSLAAQRREIIRQRLDLAFLVALDTARYMPGPVYSWFSQRPFGGERMSVLVTHPGAWDIDRFLGVRVRDAYPLPAVALPPGLQLVASRHDGRLSLTVSFVDTVIGTEQVRSLASDLEADVLDFA
ncbi:MAG: hypothetical protein JRI23_28855 [Deltaproteobacteria bacterium]|jgi:hypothetical protein|nr:hypothetical protein [Deltaproteobacteria bacterium]MBW2536133.1 hypothetical protein [Deltaproteobacteria bacterium]